MNGIEVSYCLDHITLIVDTRERKTEQSEHRLGLTNLPYIRRKLDAGDYSAMVTTEDEVPIDFSGRLAIERKMSLDELANCFCHGRERFTREFERAKANGTKMYLLIENGSIDMILQHKYKSKMHPNAFFSSLFSFEAKYDCKVIFCSSVSSGIVIKEIIKKELEQMLYEYE